MTAGNVYAYAESPHHKNGGTIEEACGALLLDAVVMGVSMGVSYGIMGVTGTLAEACYAIAKEEMGVVIAWGVKTVTLGGGCLYQMPLSRSLKRYLEERLKYQQA